MPTLNKTTETKTSRNHVRRAPWRWAAVWGALWALLPALAHAEPETPIAALQKTLTQHWKDIRALRGDISLSGDAGLLPGIPLQSDGSGTLSAMKSGKTLLVRLDLTNTVSVRSETQSAGLRQRIVTVFDGTTQNTLTEMFGQKLLTQSEPAVNFAALAPLTGEALFRMLDEDYALSILPEQKVDGQTTHVLQGVLRTAYDNGLEPGSKLTLWFRARDGMPIMTRMTDAHGATVLQIHYANIQKNPPLTRESFSLHAPPNAVVADQTR